MSETIKETNVSEEEFLQKAAAVMKEQEVKDAIDTGFDIVTFVKFAKISKELEPVKGLKITMHTLADDERKTALKLVDKGVDLSKAAPEEYIQETKIPILVYAIDKINDKEFKTEEDRKTLFEALKKAQAMITDQLYITYSELIAEQISLLDQGYDSFKKKL